jgi:hypothetical protein
LVALADLLMLPFVYCSAFLLKTIRKVGVFKFPHCKKTLLNVGVFPIHNHYYEPQFDYRNMKYPFSQERILPGIDWNVNGQLKMLDGLCFAQELASIPIEKTDTLEFYMHNVLFGPGDAEYWYQLIRAIKPRRIYEIGSGNSTLMAIKAIYKNTEEDPNYGCKHVCIEPYEMPWLEKTGVSIIRQKIEDVDIRFFSDLEENDILFIDSSHMIRPQGDVLFEYLELLPSLNRGVIVHMHDIFSPRDYPEQWLEYDVKFWNEQYLLEAFLSHNCSWKIIGALNYLHHHQYDRLKSVAPFLAPEREPGSLYIQRVA